MEVHLGDILQLKKAYPCGCYSWEVLRLGADIDIRCLKCHCRVLIGRGVLERRLRSIESTEPGIQKCGNQCLKGGDFHG
jgi:hypothetical protein